MDWVSGLRRTQTIRSEFLKDVAATLTRPFALRQIRRLDPMRKFSITIDIAAPAERVWQVMSDTDRWHEWTPSVTSVKRLGGGAFVVGSRVVIRQPRFPPALWKLTAIERYLAFEASGLKARSENPSYRHGKKDPSQ